MVDLIMRMPMQIPKRFIIRFVTVTVMVNAVKLCQIGKYGFCQMAGTGQNNP